MSLRGRIKNRKNEPVIIRGLGIKLPPNADYHVNSDASDRFLQAGEEMDKLMLQGAVAVYTYEGRQLAAGEYLSWVHVAFGLRDAYTVPIEGFITAAAGINTWLQDAGGTEHNQVPILSPQNVRVRAVTMLINTPDVSREYELNLYSNPNIYPVNLGTLVKISKGHTFASNPNSRMLLAAGLYGLRLERISGTGNSTFTAGRAMLFVEPLFA